MSFEQLQVTLNERDSLVHLLTLGAFVDTRDMSEGLFSLYAQQASRPKWLDYFMDGTNVTVKISRLDRSSPKYLAPIRYRSNGNGCPLLGGAHRKRLARKP